MNKTFNINLGGYPFSIDEDAYEYIQNYLDTIRRHFSASEGCDEILYDIEARMAELFQEHLKGRAIISMKEIDEVIMIMGKPEDFGAEPMSETGQASGNRYNKGAGRIKTGKRLFRDPDDKKLGGVCSGIAAYFGIEDPLWLRIFFVLAALFSGGFIFVLYMVLWFMVPEATTSGDKLAMRGEPATVQNIAKVVEEELNELGDKINEWSSDLNGKKKSGDNTSGFQARSFLAEGVNVLGHVASGAVSVAKNVFKPLFVIVSVILLAALAIAWAASIVGFSYASPIFMALGPKSGFLSYLGFGSLFFTLGLPILGIILLLVRAAFSYRINKHVRTGIWTVWFLSLFTTMYATMATVREFSHQKVIETVSDYNISGQDILIKMPEEDRAHHFGLQLDNFLAEREDTWAVRDVNIKVERSEDGLVHIVKKLSSRGTTESEAQTNSSYVGNDVNIKDNVISISKYMTIPKGQKYRAQQLEYTILVPDGKNIVLDNSVRERLHSSSLLDWEKLSATTEGLKWTVTKDGAFSEQWNQLSNHIRNVSAGKYSRLIIEDGYRVIIKKGDRQDISFEGNKELVDQVDFKNLDGTLTVKAVSGGDADVTINIMVPALELVHLDNVREASIEGFIQEALKLISVNDSGEESIIGFSGKIKNLDISLDGDQVLTLSGEGKNLDLQVSNGAEIQGNKYAVETARWYGDEGENSSLNVSGTFRTKDPEAVAVNIIGHPQILKGE